MKNENMLCGRKLKFGDAEQIYMLKLIEKSTRLFLEKKTDICTDEFFETIFDNIEDCETCPWPCDLFERLEEWHEKCKKGDLL